MNGLVVDCFAGGGGASLGIEMGLGRPVDIAINHDPEAIAMHRTNHPDTTHFIEDIWNVDPLTATQGRHVRLAWFSPDCTHFSKARGGQPVSRGHRTLAWTIIDWAKAVRPDVIMMENVEEFKTWGPVLDDGTIIAELKGYIFEKWVAAFRELGYDIDWRELRASHYDTPTIRRRLFIIARCDGQPIVWPEPTHGPGRLPERSAAECIDWTIPTKSIFDRKKPLAEQTQKRIANGIKRYVIDDPDPFIVTVNHTGAGFRGQGIREPFKTVTSAHDGHGLVTPFLAGIGGRRSRAPERSVEQPLHTVMTRDESAVVTPYIVRSGHHSPASGQGDSMRGQPLERPLSSVTTHNDYNLTAPILARIAQQGFRGDHASRSPEEPLDTVLTKNEHIVVSSHLHKMYGTSKDGADIRDPMPTVTSGGNHIAEVRAFLIKYFGTAKDGQPLQQPMHTVTSKERFGLVMVAGLPHIIIDIHMRMLRARELYRAQGFPDSYEIKHLAGGRVLSEKASIRMCGNSVCPKLAKALVEANLVNNRVEMEIAA